MGRLLLVTTVALLGVGGWYASAHFSLEVHRTADGRFQYVRIVPRAAKTKAPAEDAGDQPPAAPLRPTVHVAAFNLDGLDDNRLANPKVCEALVRILSRFDVAALQNIHSANCGVLMRLKDQINATGRAYDFVTCPAQDKDADAICNAMLFDATTVEVDHASVHSISVPPGTFRARPLVAEFRVRGPPANEAFTFALVNVLVDPPGSLQDLNVLADIYLAERDRGLGAGSRQRPRRGRHHPAGRPGSRPGASRPARQPAWADGRGRRRAHHDPRHAALRQHPLRPPRHGRVYRPLGCAGHRPRARPHAPGGPGNLLAPARLGRVQLLRKRASEPCELKPQI